MVTMRSTRSPIGIAFVVLAIIALIMIIFRRKPEGLCPAGQLQAGHHCCPKDDPIKGLSYHVVKNHCEDQYGNTYHGSSKSSGGGQAYGTGSNVINASQAASDCARQGGGYNYTDKTCTITWNTCNYYGRGFKDGKCLAPGTGQNKIPGTLNLDVGTNARIIATAAKKKCAVLGGAYSDGKCNVSKQGCINYGRVWNDTLKICEPAPVQTGPNTSPGGWASTACTKAGGIIGSNGKCECPAGERYSSTYKQCVDSATQPISHSEVKATNKKICQDLGYDDNIGMTSNCRCWSNRPMDKWEPGLPGQGCIPKVVAGSSPQAPASSTQTTQTQPAPPPDFIQLDKACGQLFGGSDPSDPTMGSPTLTSPSSCDCSKYNTNGYTYGWNDNVIFAGMGGGGNPGCNRCGNSEGWPVYGQNGQMC